MFLIFYSLSHFTHVVGLFPATINTGLMMKNTAVGRLNGQAHN